MQLSSNPPPSTVPKSSNPHNEQYMQPLHTFQTQMSLPVSPMYNTSSFSTQSPVNYPAVPYSLCDNELSVDMPYSVSSLERLPMHVASHDARIIYPHHQLDITASKYMESLSVSTHLDHLSSPVTPYLDHQLSGSVHDLNVYNSVSVSPTSRYPVHQPPPSPNEGNLKFEGDVSQPSYSFISYTCQRIPTHLIHE